MFDEPFWFAEPEGPARRRPRDVMREDDLRGQRLLLLTEGHCLRDQALAICGTADREADGDFRATSLETILQMVATGLGSTLLPAMACGDARPRSVTSGRWQAGVGRRIGLVWRRSLPASPVTSICWRRLSASHLPSGVRRVLSRDGD